MKGERQAAWDNTTAAISDGIDYVASYKNTVGICVSISGSVALGGEATGCFVRTLRPDGKTDYGVTGTIEEQVGGGAGVGITGGLVHSNADDFQQIRGAAAGFGASAGMGLGVAVNHRGTFDTRNSQGDIVHSYTAGVGVAAGVEGNFGSGVTGVTRLFTW